MRCPRRRRLQAPLPEGKARHPPGKSHPDLRAVLTGEADLCVATEAIADYPDLISMPVYQWNRCVVVPPNIPC